eukprot:3604666-Rhodomonas_salina.1
MLATLADNAPAHVQAHLAPTGLTNCARARRSWYSVRECERRSGSTSRPRSAASGHPSTSRRTWRGCE